MNKLILASHGMLSKGMLDSAQFITGKIDNVECITAYVDSNIDYEELIKQKVEEFNYSQGHLIVATDILGGSVNNEFLKYIGNYPFYLISGVNLITLISLINKLNGEITDDTMNDVVSEARNSIVYCNQIVSSDNEDF